MVKGFIELSEKVHKRFGAKEERFTGLYSRIEDSLIKVIGFSEQC